jgi:hypothetical protein
MIDPKKVALFIPPGLKKFKHHLFERIGKTIGKVVRDDPKRLLDLPSDIIPIIGCTPSLRPIIASWKNTGRTFIYWDRGYARRVFATWLPRGTAGGYYRWHVNTFQMERIMDVPGDRWRALHTEVSPWRRGGKNIVIASTLSDYWSLHGIEGWVDRTAAYLKTITDRPVIIRDKESKLPLQDELKEAHILVAHGSIAAVESVIMGCPVCVDQSSAAALVGITDLAQIENPVYPDRQQWLHSLAYCQFNEEELVNGLLWRILGATEKVH